jgi:hypothetical protein
MLGKISLDFVNPFHSFKCYGWISTFVSHPLSREIVQIRLSSGSRQIVYDRSSGKYPCGSVDVTFLFSRRRVKSIKTIELVGLRRLILKEGSAVVPLKQAGRPQ